MQRQTQGGLKVKLFSTDENWVLVRLLKLSATTEYIRSSTETSLSMVAYCVSVSALGELPSNQERTRLWYLVKNVCERYMQATIPIVTLTLITAPISPKTNLIDQKLNVKLSKCFLKLNMGLQL